MHYGQIITMDTANGPGFRVSLFVSGCSNHCEGCFQPQTWDPNFGMDFTHDLEDYIIEELKEPCHNGRLTILGGDPFELYNQGAVFSLLERVVKELPKKNIWIYTGYLYEDLISEDWVNHTIWTKSILDFADVIVDGPFILSKKDLRLRLCGSRNQRIIDMNKTRKRGELTIWKG